MNATSPVLVRPADESDAEAVARVHVAAWRAAYRDIIPDDVLDRLDIHSRAEHWASHLAEGSSHTLVAEKESDVVGFVSFGATRDEDDDAAKVGEIRAMYVAPHMWGQGAGWALGISAIEDLAEEGFEEVTLWVLDDNQRAQRFYEQLGFEFDGMTKEVTIGVPLEVMRYRRII
ncbi:MAG: GNAT family N-acetyltransferase [Planctomycetaceae bacterium]